MILILNLFSLCIVTSLSNLDCKKQFKAFGISYSPKLVLKMEPNDL